MNIDLFNWFLDSTKSIQALCGTGDEIMQCILYSLWCSFSDTKMFGDLKDLCAKNSKKGGQHFFYSTVYLYSQWTKICHCYTVLIILNAMLTVCKLLIRLKIGFLSLNMPNVQSHHFKAFRYPSADAVYSARRTSGHYTLLSSSLSDAEWLQSYAIWGATKPLHEVALIGKDGRRAIPP